MKRILLGLSFALALLGLSTVGASAACSGSTASLVDSASNTRLMAIVNDPTGANCAGVTSAVASQPTVTAGNTLNGVTANTTGTSVAVTGFPNVLVNLNCSVTCSGGTTLTLKGADVSGTFGNTLMFKMDGAQAAGAAAQGPVVSVQNQSGQAYFCAPNPGFTNMRVDASAYSAGTITATITPINANLCGMHQSSDPALLAASTGSTPAGNFVIGQVGINQATKTVTNGVMNAGSTYNHIAASQTAQALTGGGGGATGDYLSHCVIYPSTTAAGSVTVFDNTNSAANNVIEFTTGTLSNLAPIPLPIGALSVNGAWKVTTGANETVVCYGKFT